MFLLSMWQYRNHFFKKIFENSRHKGTVTEKHFAILSRQAVLNINATPTSFIDPSKQALPKFIV